MVSPLGARLLHIKKPVPNGTCQSARGTTHLVAWRPLISGYDPTTRDYTPASSNGGFRPSLLSVRISVGGSGVIFGPRFRVPSHPPGLSRRALCCPTRLRLPPGVSLCPPC